MSFCFKPRIVLMGKTGSGKSATGNTVLEGHYFEVKTSASPVTKICKMKENINFKVFELPDLSDCATSADEMNETMKEYLRCTFPGPHVFLLVIKIDRFTNDVRTSIQWLTKMFGEECLQYTIVLFTHGDQLRDRTIEQFLEDSAELRQLVESCGNRYLAFNNDDNSSAQVESLRQMIHTLIQNNKEQFYSNETYKAAREREEILETTLLIGVCAIAALSTCFILNKASLN